VMLLIVLLSESLGPLNLDSKFMRKSVGKCLTPGKSTLLQWFNFLIDNLCTLNQIAIKRLMILFAALLLSPYRFSIAFLGFKR
jgi:hypothetical protein